jgi:hypothetical protein
MRVVIDADCQEVVFAWWYNGNILFVPACASFLGHKFRNCGRAKLIDMLDVLPFPVKKAGKGNTQQ